MSPYRGDVGAVPGLLEVDPEASPSVVHCIAYGPDEIVEADSPDGLKQPVLWLNVDGLGTAEVLANLGATYELHALALEDVTHTHQQAKVEPYPNQLFMVVRMARIVDGELDLEQVSLFLLAGTVISFQERSGDCLEPVRVRLREAHGRIRSMPSSYLAYAIVDAVVDHYYPVIEHYSARLEALEAELLERPKKKLIREIYEIRRDLMDLHRAAWPLRDALSRIRHETESIPEDVQVYFRDCHDHAGQILNAIESYREMARSLLDIYASSTAQRLNEVMKVLTIIATLFIPLSFVAGVDGMNFEYMPELAWPAGYFVVLGVMLASASAMLLYFWRKGWLSGN